MRESLASIFRLGGLCGAALLIAGTYTTVYTLHSWQKDEMTRAQAKQTANTSADAGGQSSSSGGVAAGDLAALLAKNAPDDAFLTAPFGTDPLAAPSAPASVPVPHAVAGSPATAARSTSEPTPVAARPRPVAMAPAPVAAPGGFHPSKSPALTANDRHDLAARSSEAETPEDTRVVRSTRGATLFPRTVSAAPDDQDTAPIARGPQPRQDLSRTAAIRPSSRVPEVRRAIPISGDDTPRSSRGGFQYEEPAYVPVQEERHHGLFHRIFHKDRDNDGY